MQVLTTNCRGKVRVKNVNSHPFICVCIPVNYNKTANINVKNCKNDKKGDISQHHIDA